MALAVKMWSMHLMDGRKVARRIRAEVAEGVAALRRRGVEPGLGVVLVGDDPASAVYVGMKERASDEAGIRSVMRKLPADATREDVLRVVVSLNEDPAVHGVLVQSPLPKGVDELEVFSAISPEKDVDGVGEGSMGRLALGRPGFASCTAEGIVALLDAYGVALSGRHCVVIGRSPIVGKPLSLMLTNRDATVTLCHSRTEGLEEHARRADVLVAAVGRAGFVGPGMVKPGAAVIDAGYNRLPGQRGDVGDVEFEAVKERAGMITPVPGGVGPMTIAVLMRHALRAAEVGARH